jgi:hypothetical protein
MMHGHEDASYPDGRKKGPNNSNQGTVLGPYVHHERNSDYGFIRSDVRKQVDFMTSALFGYMFNISGKNRYVDNIRDDPLNRQRFYFYQGDNKIADTRGEWASQLYTDEGEDTRKILCFDIELANAYRDGTRRDERDEDYQQDDYEPYKVIDRGNDLRPFPFFKKENGTINGKFANVSGTIKYDIDNRENLTMNFTDSFFNFLTSYFDLKGMTIKKFGEENIE